MTTAPRTDWRHSDSLFAAALVVLTLLPYWQVSTFDLVSLDDRQYVAESILVRQGLAPWAIWDAFFGFHADNWHPLVWWSLMLDHQLYGDSPGAFHVENLFWHIANCVVLFVALKEMTGACVRSFIVAAVFSVHPLHVESVAWVSERKDVLSGFFWMLGLWSYGRCVRSSQAPGWWLCVTGCVILGLMAKQIVVTLPMVFLLLDLWPLQRIVDPRFNRATIGRVWRLFFEKLPWFMLCAAAAGLAKSAQTTAQLAENDWPLNLRLSNAVIVVFRYLWKSIYPIGLSIQYPYDAPSSALVVLFAVISLIVLSTVCFLRIHRQPALFVGWSWFLVTLTPVIGFIQLGTQSMADRYMYLPLIGISIGIVWSIPLPSSAGARRWTYVGGLYLVALTFLTSRQTAVWRNSTTLYDHAIAVDPTNEHAHYAIAHTALATGDIASHLLHLRQAIEWDRRRSNARDAFAGQDQARQKMLNRRWSQVYSMIGRVEASRRQTRQAIKNLRQAVLMDPDDPDIRMTLGMMLVAEGEFDEAFVQFDEILKRNPQHANAAGRRAAFANRRSQKSD